MSRIAIFHNALCKTDGVSLEVDKWRQVFESMGHQVFYCAGNDDAEQVICIPELSFMHPETYKILRNATVELRDYNEAALKKAVEAQAAVIEKKLMDFIKEYAIDFLNPNNLLSVGYHLPALIALSNVVKNTGLATINHCHDFYFEDSGEVEPTCPYAQKVLDDCAPPAFPNVVNIVINKIARDILMKHKGMQSIVVPNVFDFDQPQWTADDYNRDFRRAFDIRPTDLLVLQATRVLNRKGIEMAIDVAAALNKPQHRAILESRPLYDGRTFTKNDRIVLLCAGRIEKFGITDDYQANLLAKAEDLGVDIRFVGDYVKHGRGTKNNRKVYSLWDAYVDADFVTYPSCWEGYGNQFIEAVFAKLPVVLYEYPVYKTDIGGLGFDVVSLGGELAGRDDRNLVTLEPAKVDAAARGIAEVLIDPARYKEMTERNYRIGRQNLSFATLRTIIEDLFARLGR